MSEEKPNSGLYLATRPQKLPMRTRACGIWVSAYAQGSRSLIIDTAQVPGLAEMMQFHNPAGDLLPTDCLLVVVSPELLARLTEKASRLPYPVSGPFMAAMIIDDVCLSQPGLAERMGWYTEH